jgi:monovalent cation/hydrogen antiporter
VTAATRGHFSVVAVLLKFLQLSVGGVAFGLALGFVIERARRRVHTLRVEAVVSVATPYVAYISADKLHLSGVLATVAVGIYLGWRFDHRTELLSFWNVLTFLLSSTLFVLLGAQLRPVARGLHGYSTWTLVGDALLVFAAVTLVRAIWVLAMPHGSWRDRVVLGWAGMRGALSLAAALSIPAAVAHRDEILFLTFTTIVGGLLLLAVPFPWLLDRLAGADQGHTG